jgi:hypothetical protein
MTRTLRQRLGFKSLITIALMSSWTYFMSAQSSEQGVGQLTEAQAQALVRAVAAQQTPQSATLTSAQRGLLLQYLLTSNNFAAPSNSISSEQARMILKSPDGQGQVISSTGATPVSASAGSNEKKAGVIRIGIAMPKAQLGQGANGPTSGEPVRVILAQYLAGPSVEAISIAALLPDQIEAEAKSKQCDYLVYSSVSQKKSVGGMGFLKNASSFASVIPMVGMAGGMAGAVAATTATTAATQAATLSNGVKAKSDVTLEFHLNAADNPASVLSKSLNAKATADGEDIITPLIEQEATAIIAEVSKKK